MGEEGAPYGAPTLLSFGSIPGAAHGNARSPLHLLHGRHTRHTSHTWHTLHWSTRRIGCAIGTEGPAQFQQTLALGAGALEFVIAVNVLLPEEVVAVAVAVATAVVGVAVGASCGPVVSIVVSICVICVIAGQMPLSKNA